MFTYVAKASVPRKAMTRACNKLRCKLKYGKLYRPLLKSSSRLSCNGTWLYRLIVLQRIIPPCHPRRGQPVASIQSSRAPFSGICRTPTYAV